MSGGTSRGTSGPPSIPLSPVVSVAVECFTFTVCY